MGTRSRAKKTGLSFDARVTAAAARKKADQERQRRADKQFLEALSILHAERAKKQAEEVDWTRAPEHI